MGLWGRRGYGFGSRMSKLLVGLLQHGNMVKQLLQIGQYQFRVSGVFVRRLVAQFAQQLPLLGAGQHAEFFSTVELVNKWLVVLPFLGKLQ